MRNNFIGLIGVFSMLLMVSSCTGSSSFFGDVPDLMYKFNQTRYSLEKEEQTLKTEKEREEFIAKRAETIQKYVTKIENATNEFVGKPLDFIDNENFVVKAPVSFTLISVNSEMNVFLDFSGEIVAGRDINVDKEYNSYGEYVPFYLVGLNRKKTDWGGFALFAGKIYPEKIGDEYVIKAGTPVKFEHIYLNPFDCEDYMGIQVFGMALEDPK